MWFWIALITPVAHSMVNHIDGYLTKLFEDDNVGSLALFSSLFAFVGLPIIWLIYPEIFEVTTVSDSLLLMLSGGLIVVAYIPYFHALVKDQVSVAVPLLQLIPVFGFVLGYFFLSETLTRLEFVGSAIIVAGSLAIAWDVKLRQFRSRMTLLMIASSILYAVNGVLFKFVAEDAQQFWPALFWDFAGKAIFGVLIFIFIGKYRRQFIDVIKSKSRKVISLNVINEILGLVGEGALLLAALMVPVVLAQAVSGLQPVFVLLSGVILAKFWKGFSNEDLTPKVLLHKSAAVAVIVVGSILINL